MKRIRILGVCLVAVFAMSIAAASSASASPFILHLFAACVKASKVGKEYVGKFTSKECTPASKVATGGKYELASAIGDKSTSKSKTSTLYSYIPSNESTPWTGGAVVGVVTCKKSTGTQTITGNETEESVINFEDCSSEGKKCTSPGNTTGDIKTAVLTVTLRLEAGKVVAVSGPKTGTVDAEFDCEGLTVVTTGGAIGVLSGDIEAATKKADDTLTVNPSTGEPGVSFYEEGKEGEEGSQTLALLVSEITPPGVDLPGGENTTQELKLGAAIGVYPQSDV